MRLSDLSAGQLRHAAKLQDQIEALKKKLSQAFGEVFPEKAPTKRRKMSAAARRKIAAAQKTRWAKSKASLN